MPKALVLGGKTGLVGQALVKELNEKNWEVETLGREDGPITESAFLAEKLASANADAIFNGVAWTQVDDAEAYPESALEINRVFPDILSRIIAGMDKGRLIHFSTDFVFSGQPPQDYWRESDPTAPLSVYASTKLAGEKAVIRNLRNRSAIIRSAWLFGPGRKNFVSSILTAAQKQPSLNVVDDQMGSPTYTRDLASWSVALAAAEANGIWHAVNSGHATWHELAQEAVSLASLDARVQPISSAQWPQKAKRPKNSILSNAKLSAFLGFKPRPWQQAIRDYIFGDYLKNNG